MRSAKARPGREGKSERRKRTVVPFPDLANSSSNRLGFLFLLILGIRDDDDIVGIN